jgi:hypothetical protein
MELWLPTENWNGKFQAVGNGGWAGSMPSGTGAPQLAGRTMASALKDGYAAASNDTGHKGNGADASFALGHPEKLVDFAGRAVHEMVVKSKAIIGAFYGSVPKLSYWNGCSSGGRQGLTEAQRYRRLMASWRERRRITGHLMAGCLGRKPPQEPARQHASGKIALLLMPCFDLRCAGQRQDGYWKIPRAAGSIQNNWSVRAPTGRRV